MFRGLYKLEHIDLSGNSELSSIDDGLLRGLSNLSAVTLKGNNIKQLNLPSLFKSSRNLADLDLSNNQLDNRTFNRENVTHLSNLKILTLNDNQLENVEFVREMTRLQMLELKNNKIESIEEDGYNLLGRLRSIQYLDLSGNRFKALSKDLFAHLEHQLVKLDVCGNLFNSAPGLGLRLIDHLEGVRRANLMPPSILLQHLMYD